MARRGAVRPGWARGLSSISNNKGFQRMMQVKFKLTGRTPLLMHSDSIEASEEVKAWQKDPANKGLSVAGDDRSPAWTWQGYLYSDGEHVAVPASNIMVCLRQAGVQIPLGKGSKGKTLKEATQSCMYIDEEFCRFESNGRQIPVAPILSMRADGISFEEQSDAVRGLGFRLYLKRARIGQSKHIRCRPRFDNWSVSGTVFITRPDIISINVLDQLFGIAGNVGLGDWRPGCKTPGSFGMFSHELVG